MSWSDFKLSFWRDPESRFSIDLTHAQLNGLQSRERLKLFQTALEEQERIEAGERVNIDEDRMVGHYWLRAPELSPTIQIKEAIEKQTARVRQFVERVHSGQLRSGKGKPFTDFIQIGIGGSALGPQLLTDCFGADQEGLRAHYIDNTDADGMARTFRSIESLDQTLVLVVSKSGGTKETRNGMLAAKRVFEAFGLNFSKNAVAVTGEDSQLDETAKREGWLERFPMWDWVGGRTSLWSAVGLLPAALSGLDTEALLKGAAYMDKLCRADELPNNPAGMLSHVWYTASYERFPQDMVVLPYKDRLILLSRYLQQLVMESLGKTVNREGRKIEDGISVYGNKGSTDQHAFVQQLRDGRRNFFVTFIEVLRDFPSAYTPRDEREKLILEATKLEVEEGVTCCDYLHGFLLGTRAALSESNRRNLTIALPEPSPFYLGMVLALFEKSVTFYAAYKNLNAYHQPGVEAGKKAATRAISLQKKIFSYLDEEKTEKTVKEIVVAVGEAGMEEEAFRILERAAEFGRVEKHFGEDVTSDSYKVPENTWRY